MLSAGHRTRAKERVILSQYPPRFSKQLSSLTATKWNIFRHFDFVPFTTANWFPSFLSQKLKQQEELQDYARHILL